MIRFFIALYLVFSFDFNQASAVTCTEGDNPPSLCNLEIFPGTRCANLEHFQNYCDNTTDGCNGQCIGFVPTGHWYPLNDGITPRWRCRCGCVAESTTFLTNQGKLTALDLINNRGKDVMVSSWDGIDFATYSLREIDSVVYAKEKIGVKILTAGGREIVLSRAHPVVVADREGHLQGLKKAEAISAGDILMSMSGETDEVVSSQEIDYGKNMVNFNVLAQNPAERLIVTNELLTGDLAWQESLNRSGSRQWFRNDVLKAIEAYNSNNREPKP